MSTRTSQRRLAAQQRQLLEDLGHAPQDIEAFAQIFTSTTDNHGHGLGCAADRAAAEPNTSKEDK